MKTVSLTIMMGAFSQAQAVAYGEHDVHASGTLENYGHSPSGKLAVCEGDCDRDTQCKGHLKCFQRSNGEKVPGCAEAANSPKHYDFCYDPLVAKDIYVGTLKTIGTRPNPRKANRGKLEVCEGDCDNDNHCKGHLQCRERDSNEPVPGCAASSSAVSGWDYCYDPTQVLAEDAPQKSVLSTYGANPVKASKNKLNVCEGDCDNDTQCMGNLKCFQRSNGEKVPGCAEGSNSPKHYDYCYNPAKAKNEHLGTLTTIGTHWNSRKANQGNLEVCEGDCDNDDHCKGHLRCMQRDSNEPVPGCAASSSAVSGWDYCYEPYMPNVVKEDHDEQSCTNNCKDWTCATWCRCFNEADASAYAADGCEDNGDSECECK